MRSNLKRRYERDHSCWPEGTCLASRTVSRFLQKRTLTLLQRKLPRLCFGGKSTDDGLKAFWGTSPERWNLCRNQRLSRRPRAVRGAGIYPSVQISPEASQTENEPARLLTEEEDPITAHVKGESGPTEAETTEPDSDSEECESEEETSTASPPPACFTVGVCCCFFHAEGHLKSNNLTCRIW